MVLRILIFLLINFAGLGIGSFFTNPGVSSFWYQNLNKAPWTPPGWVFGAAWTLIMICFSVYLAFLYKSIESQRIFYILFALAWILNVLWNPVFFHFHAVFLALIVISLLTVCIGLFVFHFYLISGLKTLLILPYLIWLILATSLNAYILINN